MDSQALLAGRRSRIGWWLLTLGVGLVFLFVLSSVVEVMALGLFIYYTMRPLYDRLHRVVRSPGIAAAVTLGGVGLPILALVTYVGFRAFREVVRAGLNWTAFVEVVFGSALVSTVESSLVVFEEPGRPIELDPATLYRGLTQGSALLEPFGNAVVTLFLAVAFAFFLLRDGDRVASWFRTVFDGADRSTFYAYARAVDHDLRTIYLGHVATALLVGIAAAIVYNGFNAVAPSAITIPLPTMLGVLTGVASLVPIVVGKLVYVPLSLYLAMVAIRSNAPILPVLGLFAVSFVLLDLLPLLFLRPYLAGRQLHVGLVMFSYAVGTLVFGWYGLFLGPLLLVVGLHLLGIVVPELVHGEPVTPAGIDLDPFVTESDSGTGVENGTPEEPSG